ncbi:unnamed protein product, partial [Didymodactylos carnosus]
IMTVITQWNELFAKLSDDQLKREKIENAVAMSVFTGTEKTHTNLKSENGIFMWFQLFIEVLLRMPHIKEVTKDELVKLCKEIYVDNNAELVKITELNDTYVPPKAIWWYTRECYIYKLLNKALCVRDINMLFAFRFLITDIFNQLKKTQKKCSKKKFQVYRCQAVGKDGLKTLLASIGEFISMNSFLSTSKNRDVAISFAKSREEFQPILRGMDHPLSYLWIRTEKIKSKMSQVHVKSSLSLIDGKFFSSPWLYLKNLQVK